MLDSAHCGQTVNIVTPPNNAIIGMGTNARLQTNNGLKGLDLSLPDFFAETIPSIF